MRSGCGSLKEKYLAGMRKLMILIYGVVIVFGPYLVIPSIVEVIFGPGIREAMAIILNIVAFLYVACVSPFLLNFLVKRYQSFITEEID